MVYLCWRLVRHRCVLICQFLFLPIFNKAQLFHELLRDIRLSMQRKSNFVLKIEMLSAFVGHSFLDHHYYRIIKPKRHRQVVLTQLLRNENLLPLLYFDNEQFFYDLNFAEKAADEGGATDAFEADGHAVLD